MALQSLLSFTLYFRISIVPKFILGISAFYHDSAAAIVVDGEIIAAAEEERFTRKNIRAIFQLMQLIFVWNSQN